MTDEPYYYKVVNSRTILSQQNEDKSITAAKTKPNSFAPSITTDQRAV